MFYSNVGRLIFTYEKWKMIHSDSVPIIVFNQ